VNHVFYHGTTYSPEEAGYPGWLFYASVNFVPSNSFWPHLKGLNEYITRVQSILQTTKADNELLIYWPIYDVWNNPKGLDKPLKVHDVDDWLHPTEFYKQSIHLSNSGYSFDFVTDSILAKSKVVNGNISTHDNAIAYKTLLVPQSNLMSETTLENIINLAKSGARIIFQSLPKDVPGLGNLEARRAKFSQLVNSLDFKTEGNVKKCRIGKGEILVSEEFVSALTSVSIGREELADTGLKFTRRVSNGDVFYYIVNHTPRDFNDFVKLNAQGNQVILMDPDYGDVGEAEVKDGRVRLQIKSGQAFILKVASEKSNIQKWRYLGQEIAKTSLKEPWNLSFANGGPELPQSREINELKSWTDLGDERANKFSGSGVYETTFKFNPKSAHEYVLDLGKVAESARVWVNGNEVGIVWGIPFEVRIGKYLKKGKNTLKIEVNNLMANRIKDLDERGVVWRNYHEINFVNIDYKSFDAKNWKLMPSGLLGPVSITAYQ
ncbi:glycoside hydrolase, partial [Pseudoxanthomonas sp. SGD-10]